MFIFTASEYRELRGPIVYVWWRQDRCLYVGSAVNGLGRLSYHNLINNEIEMEDGDNLVIYSCKNINEARYWEAHLTRFLVPAFNGRYMDNFRKKWLHREHEPHGEIEKILEKFS